MRYTPRPIDNRAKKIMWLLIAAGALCFSLTPLFPAGRAGFQLGALVLMGAGVYIGIRYVMTSFIYEILPGEGASAGELLIYKENSRRGPILDARLDLAQLRYVAPLPREGGREREVYQRFPQVRLYEYTPSMGDAPRFVAVFLDSANNATGVVMEVSPEFRAALESHVYL